jgi:hypothetical protein
MMIVEQEEEKITQYNILRYFSKLTVTMLKFSTQLMKIVTTQLLQVYAT